MCAAKPAELPLEFKGHVHPGLQMADQEVGDAERRAHFFKLLAIVCGLSYQLVGNGSG